MAKPGYRRGARGTTAALSRTRMVLVCLALLLEGMSASGINVQLAAIRDEVGVAPGELQLVAGAFLIAYAGLLPIAGSLADAVDRRRVFLGGIALFGVGCVLCAVALDPSLLILGRVVQGAGAAFSAPAALALITMGLPEGAARNRAVALYGAMGAIGFSLGLVVPGAAVTFLGWRASFLVSVPVVIVVLAATWSIRSERGRGPTRPDLVGAVLLTAGLMGGIHLIGALGSAPPASLAIEAVVVAAIAVALVARGGVRGFPGEVVRSPGVRVACLAIGGLFAGVVASMYALSLGLVESTGASALVVALLILPQPVAFSLTAGLGARLVTRRGPRPAMAASGAVLVVSLGWLALSAPSLPTWAAVLPAMAGVGLALGLGFPAASVTAVDAAPAAVRATAAGLVTTAQNVGGALGIALVTVLGLVPGAGAAVGIEPAMIASAVFVVIGVGAALAVGAGAERTAGRAVVR